MEPWSEHHDLPLKTLYQFHIQSTGSSDQDDSDHLPDVYNIMIIRWERTKIRRSNQSWTFFNENHLDLYYRSGRSHIQFALFNSNKDPEIIFDTFQSLYSRLFYYLHDTCVHSDHSTHVNSIFSKDQILFQEWKLNFPSPTHDDEM